ncbi:hypothetical protein CEXT_654791 [Caerostris extrusa]|uniref:Uncharacterized protein n=1 Tax=Caerostris extrusa TaxID=172846 RepID=A0AAV4V8U0_CAEEX|nr:hypothetical protein CEXT_654791 [Caerostris extrusa]
MSYSRENSVNLICRMLNTMQEYNGGKNIQFPQPGFISCGPSRVKTSALVGKDPNPRSKRGFALPSSNPGEKNSDIQIFEPIATANKGIFR